MSSHLLPGEMVARLGWTLLHFIWQGAAIALVSTATLRLLAQRSGAERVRLAWAMFDDARVVAAASLPPDVASNPAERSIALFFRFYGRDLDPAFLGRVIDAIRLKHRL